MKLDIGCGRSKPDGFIGLNDIDTEDTDVVHDLETGELPFEDNKFEYIRASHVLEHLTHDSFYKIMGEIARVGKEGCTVEIRGPHYLSFHGPAGNHYRDFSRNSFECFKPSHNHTTRKPQRFEIQDINYVMMDNLHIQLLSKIFGKNMIARHLPNSVSEIVFTLTVVK